MIDIENKIFNDKTIFNQCRSTNLALQKELEGKLQPQKVSYTHKNTGNRKFHTSNYKKEKPTHNTTNNNKKNNNRNQKSLVLNIPKYQWTQFIYKKTQATRLDKKTEFILMQHVRNTPQLQRQTLPQSKGLGKNSSQVYLRNNLIQLS